MTDMQVLCYCAYSNLYTGDEESRDALMEPVKERCRGDQIAYARTPVSTDDTDIHIMNEDGTNSQMVTSLSGMYTIGDSQGLAFSPEGDKIAMSLWVETDYDICVMDADGTGFMDLTPTWGIEEVHPTWVGDKIAFSTYEKIGVIYDDGSGRAYLPGTFYTPEHPTFSPDNSKLAFRNTVSNVWHILVYDFSSGKYQDLGEGGSPAWSPDGKKIAFSGGLYLNELWLMNPEGSGKMRLCALSPQENYMIGSITWSSGSEKIAFDAINYASENSDYDIYVINADGTDLLNITFSPDVHEQFPAWKP